MENKPNFNPKEGEGEKNLNFHKVFEDRLELKKTIKNEFGITKNGGGSDLDAFKKKIYEKHYKDDLVDLEDKASSFSIEENGGFSESKKILEKQKNEYEKELLNNLSKIDYSSIRKENPQISKVQESLEEISKLKDYRIHKIFEILDPKCSKETKERNEKILDSVKNEIIEKENFLEGVDQNTLQQAKLVEYKKNLSQPGHICITPEVEKDLDAIGDRMLTSKPMLLHGPTGTGKTSLARFASEHFTGKTPEMVFCNPQTREANVWGKTGLRPSGESGAIETVEIYGPLAKAMTEGKVVIFDEFTALPKEQMVFIKGVFNAKVGDKVNIVGNGIVDIKPGFQMIFTANLKSEKNPERQELPPEITREFEQNNVKIDYNPPDEAYDIMLARLMNKDGSIDMSFYDLNTTLPNLCKVMSEIQESYTNETNKDLAKNVGAMDASGKFHSLKKFVMTQGSVEAIFSSWIIEKLTKKETVSFSEFLDQRFKTALTFDEYSKEDRILAAKILASKGFLTTLSAEELNLPEDIFKFNAIKSLRGEDATEELRNKSGDVKHLSLKEVAELDPFNKREELLRKKAEALLEDGLDSSKDEFLGDFGQRFEKIYGKDKKSQTEEIETTYTFTNQDGQIEKTEQITLNIEQKLNEYISFYKTHNLEIPDNFEEDIKDIWEANIDDIKEQIEAHGFNEILLIPPTTDLPDLAEKMKETKYWESDNFKQGGSFEKAQSQNQDKTRIILTHKAQNMEDHPEFTKTLNTKGQDVPLDKTLSFEEYLILSKKYFEETGHHLDEDGYTWLATKSGARFVYSGWGLDDKREVRAIDFSGHDDDLGFRSSRSYTK